jgi:hypothetical protein
MLGGAGLPGLLREAFQLLLLADVRGERDDLRGVGFLQPLDDDGGVQPPEYASTIFIT